MVLSKNLKIRIASGVATAYRWPVADANCMANEVLISGGGQCSGSIGFSYLFASIPNGNSWRAQCDTEINQSNTAYAYAVCAIK